VLFFSRLSYIQVKIAPETAAKPGMMQGNYFVYIIDDIWEKY